jgi:hypothetical protein
MQKISNILLIFLLASCSQNIKRTKVKKIEKTRKEKVLVSGPSLKKTDKTFIDITKKIGLAGEKAVHLYAVDFNNDGATDLVTLPDYYSVPNFFVFNKKSKKFKKILKFPSDKRFYASYLNFADFNSDGIQDMIVGTLNQKTELTKRPLRLYKGSIVNGNVKYTLAGKGLTSKKVKPSSAIILLDYDLDGSLDIFESNWYDQKQSTVKLVPDRILKGDKFIFKDVSYLLTNEMKYSRSLNKFTNANPTFGASTCDVDENGYPDILTASSSGHKNRLWLNLYDSKHNDRVYKDYGDESGYAQDSYGDINIKGGGNTYYSICSDYNNDGFMDIVVGELSHSYSPEEKDRSSFLTGKHHKFPPEFIRTEYTQDEGRDNWSQADRRGVWLDYNNDGLIDLLVDNSGFPNLTRLILFKQYEDHAYDEVSKQHGIDILNPSGTIVLDYNRDGRMDIITGQTKLRNNKIKNRIYAFENRAKLKGNRSIRFYLKGEKANSDGLGSMVELITSTSKQKRWYELNSGSLPSQNEKGLHFGIPKNSRLKKVKVTWPVLKNKSPLKVQYDLSSIKLKKYLEYTLCESGKIKIGRKTSCK